MLREPGREDTFAMRRTTLALSVVVALVGCGPDGADGPGTATPETPTPETAAATGASGTADPAETAVDRAAAIAATIAVRAAGCGPNLGLGTGTVIGGGDVVTAAHVVAGADAVEVTDVDGRSSTALVIHFDGDLDLALLRPAEPLGTPLPIRTDPARADDEGIVVLPRRSGDDIDVQVADVRVIRRANISTTDISRQREVDRAGFEIEGSIDPGDSGAMVVLAGGGAGIVWARSNRTPGRAWGIDLPDLARTPLPADRSAVSTGDCLR